MAPGVGDQGMAIGLALLVADGERAGLGAGADVSFGLDRPRSQQHLPVVLAGLHGEGGGKRDDLGALFRQRLEEVGKAKVVADRAADGDAFAVVGDDLVARLHRRAFLVSRAVGRGDVEEMDLAIASDLLALTVEDDRGVVDAVFAFDFFHDRAGMHEDAMLDRLPARHCVGRAARKTLGVPELVRLEAARPVEMLRQQHPVGAFLRDGLLDQRLRSRDIGGLVADRVHLDDRDFHAWAPQRR